MGIFLLLGFCDACSTVVVGQMPTVQPRPVELRRGIRSGRRLALAVATFLFPLQLPQVSPRWFSSHLASSGSISRSTTLTAWSSVAARGEEKRQRHVFAAAAVSTTEGDRDAQSSLNRLETNGRLGGNENYPAQEATSAQAAAAEAVETSSRCLPVEAGAAIRDDDNTNPRKRWPRVRPMGVTRALGKRLRSRRLSQGRTAAVADFNLASDQPRDLNSQVPYSPAHLSIIILVEPCA